MNRRYIAYLLAALIAKQVLLTAQAPCVPLRPCVGKTIVMNTSLQQTPIYCAPVKRCFIPRNRICRPICKALCVPPVCCPQPLPICCPEPATCCSMPCKYICKPRKVSCKSICCRPRPLYRRPSICCPTSICERPVSYCGSPRIFRPKPLCCPRWRCCRPKPVCCPQSLPACPPPPCIQPAPPSRVPTICPCSGAPNIEGSYVDVGTTTEAPRQRRSLLDRYAPTSIPRRPVTPDLNTNKADQGGFAQSDIDSSDIEDGLEELS